jgi:hypothetical protein
MMKCGETFLKILFAGRPGRNYIASPFSPGGEEGAGSREQGAGSREQGAGSRERKSEVGAQGSGGVNFGRLALAGRGFFDIGVEENAEKLKF